MAWTALSARWYADHPPAARSVGGARVLRRPVGVVAAVTPWNVPLITPAWKWLPALVAGNAVVWKPSERATGIAVAATGAAPRGRRAPATCSRCVPGGHATAAALAADERVGALHFTGSEAGGRALAALAAPRFARDRARAERAQPRDRARGRRPRPRRGLHRRLRDRARGAEVHRDAAGDRRRDGRRAAHGAARGAHRRLPGRRSARARDRRRPADRRRRAGAGRGRGRAGGRRRRRGASRGPALPGRRRRAVRAGPARRPRARRSAARPRALRARALPRRRSPRPPRRGRWPTRRPTASPRPCTAATRRSCARRPRRSARASSRSTGAATTSALEAPFGGRGRSGNGQAEGGRYVYDAVTDYQAVYED